MTELSTDKKGKIITVELTKGGVKEIKNKTK